MVSHILLTFRTSSLGPRTSAAQGSSARSTELEAASGRKLLDEYALGEKLGKGAFGVVYTCTNRESQEDFAVKLLDHANVSLSDVQHEADMIRKLAHPSVVKIHDMFHESIFVAMVLDLHRGGDLIGAREEHHRTRGELPRLATQNLVKMIVQSVAWLHQNNVVHRDVKADNFLVDVKALDDPSCQIYLTDFGTASDLAPGSRLHHRCGTRAYWSPEVLDRDYALPVDMWATGIVMFGLLALRFPFQGESETRTQPVQCLAGTGEDGEALLFALLEKEEVSRLTASQALEHPFLSCVNSGTDLAEEQAFIERQAAEEAVEPPRHSFEKASADEAKQQLMPLRSRSLSETSAGETMSQAGSDFTWFDAEVMEHAFAL